MVFWRITWPAFMRKTQTPKAVKPILSVEERRKNQAIADVLGAYLQISPEKLLTGGISLTVLSHNMVGGTHHLEQFAQRMTSTKSKTAIYNFARKSRNAQQQFEQQVKDYFHSPGKGYYSPTERRLDEITVLYDLEPKIPPAFVPIEKEDKTGVATKQTNYKYLRFLKGGGFELIWGPEQNNQSPFHHTKGHLAAGYGWTIFRYNPYPSDKDKYIGYGEVLQFRGTTGTNYQNPYVFRTNNQALAQHAKKLDKKLRQAVVSIIQQKGAMTGITTKLPTEPVIIK